MNIVAGILTGITASMGLGGGFILLIYLSVFTETEQAIAQGINILFFLPIALVSTVIHARNKLIDWKTVWKYAVVGVVGAVIGSIVSGFIDTSLLRKMFGVFLIIIALKELFFKAPNRQKTIAK